MIVLPAMTADQEAAWHGLLDLAERRPTGWTLIGGQMVHVHCAERGYQPHRSTPDVDTLVDVRAVPTIFADLTADLQDLGFSVAGETVGGKHHRWVRKAAVIDVLIPSNLGRSAALKGAAGRPGLETPGAQYALNRSELVDVRVGSRSGRVARPSLIGAIIAKSAAYSVTADAMRVRHIDDVCTLSAMLARADLNEAALSKREAAYVRAALEVARTYDRLGDIPGAADGLERLGRVVDA